jgi:spermidine synthase
VHVTVERIVDSSRTPDGKPLVLVRDGDVLTIYIEHRVLMSSRLHGSEESLAEVGCEGLAERRRRRPVRVLVGGLGLGYTLRAALDLVPAHAEVEVAEVIPAIVRWHREGPLGALAGRPLEDRRVRLVLGDVGAHLRSGDEGRYDAMLLDVDNGPEALASRANRWLYDGGLARIASVLAPRGRVVFWSAFADRGFEQRLAATGLATRAVRVGAANRHDRDEHVLFVGERA